MKPIHAVLMAFGSHGDILPMIGLGRGLKARGHQVTLLVNEHFAAPVQAAGLEMLAIGTEADYQSALQRPKLHHPLWGLLGVSQLISKHFNEVYQTLQQAVASRPGPTIMVGTSLCFPMLCLKEKTGIPTAVVHLAPSLLRSSWKPPQLSALSFDLFSSLGFDEQVNPGLHSLQYHGLEFLWRTVDLLVADQIFARPLNRFPASLGLSPIKRIFHHFMHSGDLVLGFFPDWFSPRPADWPAQFRNCAFPLYDQERESQYLSTELEAFLDAGEPPIVFTGGTAFPNLKRFYAESSKACEILGQRGILLTRHPKNLPAQLPDGVIAVDYAPFSLLFERCKIVVHHGGIGTTSQALRSGVQQLIQPMAFDQFDNAAQCHRLGVAQWMTSSDYRGPEVARSLERLSAPYYRANAKLISAKVNAIDPLADAISHLESLVVAPS